MNFLVSSCDELPGEGRLKSFLVRVFEELPVEAPHLPLPLSFLPLFFFIFLVVFLCIFTFGTDFPTLICSMWESIGSTESVYSGFGKLVYTVPVVNRVKIGRLHHNNTHQMV